MVRRRRSPVPAYAASLIINELVGYIDFEHILWAVLAPFRGANHEGEESQMPLPGMITGLGAQGYALALEHLAFLIESRKATKRAS